MCNKGSFSLFQIIFRGIIWFRTRCLCGMAKKQANVCGKC